LARDSQLIGFIIDDPQILPNEKRDAKKDMYYAAIGCLLYGFVGLTNEVKLQAKALVSGSSPAATELNALLDKPM
jgi:hypothetical protein